MYVPRWELAGFDSLAERDKCPLILTMVRALVEINRREIRALRAAGYELPPLYESGAVYLPQGRQDDWKDCLAVLDSGGGSCNSLSAYRVAELNEAGIPAGPYVQTQIQRGSRGVVHVFHVLVWIGECARCDPEWECPSRALGMKSTPYD